MKTITPPNYHTVQYNDGGNGRFGNVTPLIQSMIIYQKNYVKFPQQYCSFLEGTLPGGNNHGFTPARGFRASIFCQAIARFISLVKSSASARLWSRKRLCRFQNGFPRWSRTKRDSRQNFPHIWKTYASQGNPCIVEFACLYTGFRMLYAVRHGPRPVSMSEDPGFNWSLARPNARSPRNVQPFSVDYFSIGCDDLTEFADLIRKKHKDCLPHYRRLRVFRVSIVLCVVVTWRRIFLFTDTPRVVTRNFREFYCSGSFMLPFPR